MLPAPASPHLPQSKLHEVINDYIYFVNIFAKKTNFQLVKWAKFFQYSKYIKYLRILQEG